MNVYLFIGRKSRSLMMFLNKTIFDSFVVLYDRKSKSRRENENKARSEANGDAFSLANVINNLIFIKMHFNHPQNTDTQNCVCTKQNSRLK